MAAKPLVPGAPYLRHLRQLTIHDEEFQRVAYLLRSALGSVSAEVLSIHAVNSPQQDATFEGNHAGCTVLDSWVNSRDLPEENTVHNIVHHGGRFRITDANKGAIFAIGTLGIDETNTPPGPHQYEFLYCRVATGRSFVVDPSQIGTHGIPSGYDSIIVHKDANDASYLREYILNDESRIYPAFVVTAVFDVVGDRQLPPHDPNANELNELAATMCAEHANMPLQFFDPVSYVPLCITCKMTGSHSSGENATHQLTFLQDAYLASMEDLDREAAIVEDRRRTIGQQLESVDRRMAAVNANYDRCQDEIYEIVQRAVQVLHEETQSKLSALLSDESELKRQLEYYAWMEAFLAYQRRTVDPVEFLQAYRSHSAALAAAPSEICDGATGVRADIRVVGRLEVVVDDTAVAPVQPQQQQAARQQMMQQTRRGSSQGSNAAGAAGAAAAGWQQGSGAVPRSPGVASGVSGFSPAAVAMPQLVRPGSATSNAAPRFPNAALPGPAASSATRGFASGSRGGSSGAYNPYS